MIPVPSSRIVSVNVGQPQELRWRGHTVITAIVKTPVSGPVRVHRLNVEGDRQADPAVHGGVDKAVYIYAAEHYATWIQELGRTGLPWGMFGENLTVEGGFSEETVCAGDRFRAGTAELMAVRARMPCRKLAMRFGSQRFIKQFARSERFGIYCRVVQEGHVAAGDAMEFTAHHPAGLTIRDLGRLMLAKHPDRTLLELATTLEELPERLRQHFRDRLLEGPRRPRTTEKGNSRFG